MARANGGTLKEMVRELGVSRPTALRWLGSMEKEGLLYRSYQMRQRKRGRPRGVYHATGGLKRFIEEQKKGDTSMVTIAFETVKSMCKHQTGGMCRFFAPKIQKCDASGCSYLKGH